MAVPRVLCRIRLLINNDFSHISKYSPLIKSVSLNKCVHVQKHFRTNLSTCLVLNRCNKHEHHSTSSSSSSSSSSSDSDQSDSDEDDVTVEYHKGLPQITVPLPSRKERCKFSLKPISNTVGDFLEMLKKEDRGIDRVVCKTYDGTRIAASNTIETLLDNDFRLIINDNSYNVNTPKQERLTGEAAQQLNDVQNLVVRLYEALHVQEHQVSKERELITELETLQQQLQPLEEKREQIEMVAVRKSNWLAWTGLGLMSVQFGILARLTWWEYSWDIMEPVTYFVTYGTAMAVYSYYVLTKEEYVLADVRDRQQLLTLHKKAKKLGFDLTQYNTLKEQIRKVEYDLRKLRNPRRLLLPPKVASVGTTNAETNAVVENVATDLSMKTTGEAKNGTVKEKDSALKNQG